MEKTYKVYVLKNSTGKYYVGVSEDVGHRLSQHNAGESKWTAKFRPWNLVWTSDPMSLSSARRLENLLKKQKGGRGSYRITKLPPPVSGSKSRACGILGYAKRDPSTSPIRRPSEPTGSGDS